MLSGEKMPCRCWKFAQRCSSFLTLGDKELLCLPDDDSSGSCIQIKLWKTDTLKLRCPHQTGDVISLAFMNVLKWCENGSQASTTEQRWWICPRLMRQLVGRWDIVFLSLGMRLVICGNPGRCHPPFIPPQMAAWPQRMPEMLRYHSWAHCWHSADMAHRCYKCAPTA